MIRQTAILSIMLSLICHHLAADEAILLDSEAPREVAIELTLYGYRSFPQEIFTFQKGDQYGIPTELIYASAAQIPEIKQEADEAGQNIRDMKVFEVVRLLRSQYESEMDLESLDWTGRRTSVPSIGVTEVDAKFITKLISSELIDENFSVFEGKLVGKPVDMISIDQDVAETGVLTRISNF